MSHYATQMLAHSRQAELLREADHARLAKIARQRGRTNDPSRVAIRTAFRQLAAAASTILR